MRRRQLLSLLREARCYLLREGAKHSVFFNPRTKKETFIPRHSEINDYLAKQILEDLSIEIRKER